MRRTPFLEPRLRELAFATASRLDRSALCDSFHSSVGRATGLTDAQLAGLPGHAGGGEYSDLDRLVVDSTTAPTVAGAGFSNRLTTALGLAPPG